MKKTLLHLILVLTALLGAAACSTSDEVSDSRTITLADLPAEARALIAAHYADTGVAAASVDMVDGKTIYHVGFDSGQAATFNADGLWVELKAPFGESVPSGIIPERIARYLYESYQGYGVNDALRTGEGFRMTLTTGVALLFDPVGEFVGVVDAELP